MLSFGLYDQTDPCLKWNLVCNISIQYILILL